MAVFDPTKDYYFGTGKGGTYGAAMDLGLISHSFLLLYNSPCFILLRRREAQLIWRVEGDLTTPKSIRIHLSHEEAMNTQTKMDLAFRSCIRPFVLRLNLLSLSSTRLGWINSSNRFLSSFFVSFLHSDHCIGTLNQRAQTKPHLAGWKWLQIVDNVM